MDPQLQPFPKLGPRFLTEEENRKRMSELLNPNYYEERTKKLYEDEVDEAEAPVEEVAEAPVEDVAETEKHTEEANEDVKDKVEAK